jgi:hypothetical protein
MLTPAAVVAVAAFPLVALLSVPSVPMLVAVIDKLVKGMIELATANDGAVVALVTVGTNQLGQLADGAAKLETPLPLPVFVVCT